MVPRILPPALHEQLARSRTWRQADRAACRPGVELRHALAAKFPQAAASWGWFRAFPAPHPSRDLRSGIIRRRHLHE